MVGRCGLSPSRSGRSVGGVPRHLVSTAEPVLWPLRVEHVVCGALQRTLARTLPGVGGRLFTHGACRTPETESLASWPLLSLRVARLVTLVQLRPRPTKQYSQVITVFTGSCSAVAGCADALRRRRRRRRRRGKRRCNSAGRRQRCRRCYRSTTRLRIVKEGTAWRDVTVM